MMHACGHDGHTAMLLGAAKYLAQPRNFAGRVAVIFQPAEEGGAGAKAMIDDGLLEQFDIKEVFGLHNIPGIPLGSFAIRKGPIQAAMDKFTIHVHGVGGHAAHPDKTVDPIIAANAIVTALQTIVSRNCDPLDSVVVSVTQFNAGTGFNIIPETAVLGGGVRILNESIRDKVEKRMNEIAQSVAVAHGARCEFDYEPGYPVTFNHDSQTDFAAATAKAIVGEDCVNENIPPLMGCEDFAFILKERPGAYILLGNGDTPYVHHPEYDFSDEAIKYGIAYWVGLAETGLKF